MPTCHGASVSVLVDGATLHEYQTRVYEERREASCWIGSQVGKEFSIAVYTGTKENSKLVVEMDGSITNTMRLPPRAHHTIARCPVSETVERTFVFSKVELVEDDELADSLNPAGLGTIKLTLTKIKIVGPGNGTLYHDEIGIPARQRRLSEKEKNGIQACVILGQEHRKIPNRYLNCSHQGVIAQFIFHYRPLEYLQAQGIASILAPRRLALPPLPWREYPVARPRKRKSRETGPQPGPSRTTRTHVRQENEVAILNVSDEKDVEKLHALRTRIDKALAKKSSSVSNVRRVEKDVQKETEVIDLT